MITYKGRVVYEREKHLMTEKDAARIMASLSKEKSPAELARILWGIDVEYIQLQVLGDEDLLAFMKEFVTLVIKWIGVGVDWLWDLLIGILIPPPPPPPEPEEEEVDA